MGDWNLEKGINDYLQGEGFNYRGIFRDLRGYSGLEFGMAEKIETTPIICIAKKAIYIPRTDPWISINAAWDHFILQLALYTKVFTKWGSRDLKDFDHDTIYFFYVDGRYNKSRLEQSLKEWRKAIKGKIKEKYPLFSQLIEQDIDRIAEKVQITPLSPPPKPTIRQKLAHLVGVR